MVKKTPQIICTYSKIKDGHLDDVRNWLKVLETRKEETLESFRQEGVLMESAFIRKANGQHFLVYYMHANDVEQAMATFQQSTLAIDHFHKACWGQFTENHEILIPAFHLDDSEHSFERLPR